MVQSAKEKKTRSEARIAALQMLYILEQNPDASIMGIIESAKDTDEIVISSPEVRDFTKELAQAVLGHKEAIDALLSKYTKNWSIERLSSIDRNVLRLGVAELQGDFNTPVRVVINEVVELAKKFGTDDSAKFVNGVIDAVKEEIDYTK